MIEPLDNEESLPIAKVSRLDIDAIAVVAIEFGDGEVGGGVIDEMVVV